MIAAPPPAPVPTPIGVGPLYRPAPGPSDGRSRAGLRCGAGGARFGVHLELFAHRRAVIVPAGIGVARPFVARAGRVLPRGCSFPARTLTPTGVVEVRAGARLRLGDLFRIWRQPLGRFRLAGFRSRARPRIPVHAFVGGRPWHGDPNEIPLRRHAEIVLELGGFVPPHRDFLFPKGL